jgi:hypothetical protein
MGRRVSDRGRRESHLWNRPKLHYGSIGFGGSFGRDVERRKCLAASAVSQSVRRRCDDIDTYPQLCHDTFEVCSGRGLTPFLVREEESEERSVSQCLRSGVQRPAPCSTPQRTGEGRQEKMWTGEPKRLGIHDGIDIIYSCAQGGSACI